MISGTHLLYNESASANTHYIKQNNPPIIAKSDENPFLSDRIPQTQFLRVDFELTLWLMKSRSSTHEESAVVLPPHLFNERP
jgi:hypothetical protein